MSGRKLPRTRAAQSERNAKKRGQRRQQPVSPRQALVQQRIEGNRKRASEEIAAVQAKVLVEVAEEYYDGEVRYASLRSVDDDCGRRMQVTVNERLKPYQEQTQTPQLLSEAADVVQELNQGWIDCGWLKPFKLGLWDVPTVRIYDNGPVEAVNRARDMDMRDMGKRYREAIEAYKASKSS